MEKDKTPTPSAGEPSKRKKSPTKYWKVINGRLYARLQYRDANGRKKEKVRAIDDKRLARAAVDKMRRELHIYGEEALKSDRLTFSQLATLYTESRLGAPIFANGLKVSGLKSPSTKSMVKMLSEYFGSMQIRLIRTRELEAFKTVRLNTPVIYKNGDGETVGNRPRTITTVNRELATLRLMFSFAFQNSWVEYNPFSRSKGIIVTSAEKERDRILSHEEEVRLLAACVDPRAYLRPIIICALDTAIRRGEMFKMRWKDVNFFSGEIHIPQTNTKTERSRKVGLTSRLRDELQELWEHSNGDPERRVFAVKSDIKRSWSTACTNAGLDNFRLHDCRHTAITRMVAAGIPQSEIMKISGHSQLKTFLRYLNVTSEMVNRSANLLGNYLDARQAREIQELGSDLN